MMKSMIASYLAQEIGSHIRSALTATLMSSEDIEELNFNLEKYQTQVLRLGTMTLGIETALTTVEKKLRNILEDMGVPIATSTLKAALEDYQIACDVAMIEKSFELGIKMREHAVGEISHLSLALERYVATNCPECKLDKMAYISTLLYKSSHMEELLVGDHIAIMDRLALPNWTEIGNQIAKDFDVVHHGQRKLNRVFLDSYRQELATATRM